MTAVRTARRAAVRRWRAMVDDLAAEARRIPGGPDDAQLRSMIVLHPDHATFDRAARAHWYRHGWPGRLWRRLGGLLAGRPAAPPAPPRIILSHRERAGLPAPLQRMHDRIDAIARDWAIDDPD